MNKLYLIFRPILCFSFLLSLFLGPALRAQTIRRVKETPGTGTPDGSTWAKAIGLAAALKASASGDEVWIAAGTYKPHASTRTVSFTVKAGVKVYGGFKGTETSKDDRDPIANPTILSGDIGTTGTHTDNSYHVATITGDDAELHGLTITRGQATSSTPNSPERRGGGLYVGAHMGILLSHCTFSHNNSAGNGTGAYFAASSTATLNHCTFRNNTSSTGSGGGAVFFGTATLNHCTFARNTAALSSGGAAFGATATLQDCVFVQNRSTSGDSLYGGGGASFLAGATVTNCTFYKNTAANVGGGLRADAAGLKLRNSIFFGNTAANGGPQVWVKDGAGGSVANDDLLEIDYCLIAGGSAGLRLPSSGVPPNTPSNSVSADDATATQIFASVTEGEDTFLRLRPGSPALDAGSDTHYDGLSATSKDLDGKARKVGSAIDLGAYEFYAGFRIIVDRDGDGLIEVATLAELDHMRFNLAGTSYKGSASAGGITGGCPQSGCHGYELTKNLDFRKGCGAVGTAASACDYSDWVPQDSSGDIAAPADGTNAGWTPIGGITGSFIGDFDGNGHVIRNLYIHVRAAKRVKAGLFGDMQGSTIQNVGLTGEHMFVSVSTTSGDAFAGNLIGDANHGTIRNCYATGNVSTTTTEARAEIRASGLVGAGFDNTFSNCYATGDVTVTGAATVYAGGLSGSSNSSTIKNCYATGDISATGNYVLAGGLDGYSDRTTTRNSYHSGRLLNAADGEGLAGTAATAAELKALTAASSGWSEQSWDFGPASQWPLLLTYREVGEGNQVQGEPIASQPFVVDDDGDGLIEVASLAQLNHIRFDLAGTSYKTSSTDSGTTKGCPDADHDNSDSTPKQPTCHGYELTKNLDFTDIDAVGYQADWDPVAQKAKPEAQQSAGWPPIGDSTNAFTGTFDGNGHAIYNLYINASASSDSFYVGLFGSMLGSGVEIRNVGLTGEHMMVKGTNISTDGAASAGSFAGYVEDGTLRNCYATGPVIAVCQGKGRGSSAGGLVGAVNSIMNSATVMNCYATGDVTASGGGIRSAGGLAASFASSTVANCYATGDVTVVDAVARLVGGLIKSPNLGAKQVGGLVGSNFDTQFTNCYYSGAVKGVTGNSHGTPQARSRLKALTATRTSWSELNWDFGTNEDYPLLRAYATDDSSNQQLTSLLEGQNSRPAEEERVFDAADSVVDDDGDGLIEIFNLAQLNHIRFNLAGTSYKDSSGASGSTTGCGTNLTGAQENKCHGYELMADLDFTHSNATGHEEDWDPVVQKAKETPGAGWEPIGGTFSGTFEGNGHAIYNLYVNKSVSSGDVFVGFFAQASGTIKNVGLTGQHMYVKGSNSSTDSNHAAYVGAFAGKTSGATLRNCYATGPVEGVAEGQAAAVGGLLGGEVSSTAFTNCYVTGNVKATGAAVGSVGGLVGEVVGLSGTSSATSCYATGNVTNLSSNASTEDVGGLVGADYPLLRSETPALTVTNCYYSGTVPSGSGFRVTTSGTKKTLSELRVPEAAVGIYAAWGANDWVFGTKGQLPALLTYATDDGGSQVKGRLINGQSRAHARRAAALPTPKYALSHSTKTSFTLDGASVASGLVRRVFVHTGTLSGLSIPSMADAAGDAGSGAMIHFSLAKGEGASIVIGTGGQGTVAANTKYFVRIYDYRISDHVVSKVSPELVVWTAPSDPSAYAAGMHTTNSFVLTGEAVPAGLTRRFFLAASTLAALDVARGQVVDAPGSGLSTFELSAGEGASVKVGAGGTYSGAKALTPNTNYFVRVMDYRASGVSSGILPEVSVWTLPEAPSGYETSTKTDTSVSFSDGGAVPDGLTRRYFRSTSGSVSFPGGTPMVDGAGTVEELTGVTNAASVTFGGLAANTEYHFYFVDSRRSPALVSAHLRRGPIRTSETPDPDAPEKPIYTVGDEVTTTTISLTKADGTAAVSGTLTRRFFVSTSELDPTETHRYDGAGLPDGATTFVVNGPSAVVLGSNTPSANSSLLPNTKYFVYVSDYNTGTRKVSLAHDITGGSGTWTKPLAPTGYRVSGITDSSVSFSGGGTVPQNLTRRYFRSMSGSLMFANGAPSADAQGAFTELTGVADAASATFTGLTTGTEYHFYFVDYNAESGFSAVLRLEATPEQGAVIPPAYSVDANGVTATMIPLTKVDGTADVSNTLTRRFFVSTSELDLSETQRDGSGLPDGVTTFVVNAPGEVVLGSGSPTKNASLMPNTKYFVYVTDWNTQSGKVSTAHDITGGRGVWTLPAEVAIAAPSGAGLTSKTATTGRAAVADNTKIHWVLLKESAVSTSDLTGASIKGATKDSNIVSGRRVLNKGTLSASGTIALHAGITLSTGAHVVYYVVEGTSSGLFSAVQGVSFSVPGASAGTIPAPSYTVGTPTQTTIPLTEGSAFQNGADRRRFFVSKSDLAQLKVTDAKNGTHSGAEGEVWTFVLSENTDSVTIGSGTPEANKALEPNTNYSVRAVDYKESDGKKSVLSANLSGTTAKTPKIAFGAHKPKVYAYPNPTSGTIRLPVSEGVAKIYASDGAYVGTFNISTGQMDLSDLPVGVYVVRLDRSVFRVVKQHR